MPLKIHYLQHVPFEGLGRIESWAHDRQHQLSATRLYAGESFPTIEDIDILIVLGGPMNIYEDNKYPWLKDEKKSIERFIQQGKTTIGICLGAQLIADVLGAKVYPGQYKEIGWLPIEITEEGKTSPICKSLPPKMTVFHWHGDTFDLPKGATRLAYSAGCENQAFAYDRHVLALQFHLESTSESIQQLLTHCQEELVPGKYIQTPAEITIDSHFPTNHQALKTILNNLLDPPQSP
jgi:GMP synthase-like glutamine amidotransferase